MLKTLPEERQAAVAEYALGHTLAETVAWLGADGLRVSRMCVSRWLSWWSWRSQFRGLEADTLDFMEQVRARKPELSEGDVEAFGNDYFQLQALKLNDPKLFLKFRTARNRAEMEKLKLGQKEREIGQREEALKLEREKFERLVCERALTRAVQERAAEIAGRNAPQDEKIAAMREALFADVDALQAQGGLRLPT